MQAALLRPSFEGYILFEMAIPRMGKRADVVVVIGNVVLVIEFKVGASEFERHAIEQVHDYALDLKYFHLGSHELPIVPALVATRAVSRPLEDLSWASDKVAAPVLVVPSELPRVIELSIAAIKGPPLNFPSWLTSGYQPTPTIIQAAQALYVSHDVAEIARSDAGAQNLSVTSACIAAVVERAKAKQRKAICFVTGVPGAGKTLAGLNIATKRAQEHSDEHAVFLSGNGPLVAVLREALTRDEASRTNTPKSDAHRRVASFIQNIHHFRDDALRTSTPPHERVVVFDEAQRAWTRDQAAKFMLTKRSIKNFEMSEPEFLISVMDRHTDWCVVVCLIGGGQEINTGEAGFSEWLVAMASQFRHWDVYISDHLYDADYIRDERAVQILSQLNVIQKPELHLAVSVRSFRAESVSAFIGHVVGNRPVEARAVHNEIAQRYPIWLTRSLDEARKWLRQKARGSERFGVLASSGSFRLRPEGIQVKIPIDAATWFLSDRADVRSSFYCEEVATEFDVQGLELDWTAVCWDANFRYANGAWQHLAFRGTRWQRINATQAKVYLTNAYRVILTRARQGMVIVVPHGDNDDPTRSTSFYDPTFEFLLACGLRLLSAV